MKGRAGNWPFYVDCLFPSLRTSLPDVYRLDRELGKGRTSKLVRLVEDGFFLRSENAEVSSITAADCFEYCRIAYIGGKRRDETVDDSLSGREMYRWYADDTGCHPFNTLSPDHHQEKG